MVAGSLLSLLAIAGCRTNSGPAAAVSERVTAAAGCYELISLVTDQLEIGALRRFRLLPQSVSIQRPRFHRVQLLATRDSIADAFLPLRLWSVDSLSDTVRVQAGDGLTAQFFRGIPTANGDLLGVAGTTGDVGPPFEHGMHSARFARISCPPASIPEPPPNER